MTYQSSLSRDLAEAQEAHSARKYEPCLAVVYKLYTEDKSGLIELIARYFDSATLTYGVGLWQGKTEASRIIEIVGTLADLQKVINLAGDIRVKNNQSCVLVTWSHATSFLSTEVI